MPWQETQSVDQRKQFIEASHPRAERLQRARFRGGPVPHGHPVTALAVGVADTAAVIIRHRSDGAVRSWRLPVSGRGPYGVVLPDPP